MCSPSVHTRSTGLKLKAKEGTGKRLTASQSDRRSKGSFISIHDKGLAVSGFCDWDGMCSPCKYHQVRGMCLPTVKRRACFCFLPASTDGQHWVYLSRHKRWDGPVSLAPTLGPRKAIPRFHCGAATNSPTLATPHLSFPNLSCLLSSSCCCSLLFSSANWPCYCPLTSRPTASSPARTNHPPALAYKHAPEPLQRHPAVADDFQPPNLVPSALGGPIAVLSSYAILKAVPHSDAATSLQLSAAPGPKRHLQDRILSGQKSATCASVTRLFL